MSAQTFRETNHLKNVLQFFKKQMTHTHKKKFKSINKKNRKSCEILNEKLRKIWKDHLEIKILCENQKASKNLVWIFSRVAYPYIKDVSK